MTVLNTTVRAAAEGMPDVNRRAALAATGGAIAALLASNVPAPAGASSLPALIEAHRSVQAALDAMNLEYGELDPPNFEEICAMEWTTVHDIIGYGPLTHDEAREKMAYLATCINYNEGDTRELDQLARSFLVEPGTIAEFKVEYPREVVS